MAVRKTETSATDWDNPMVTIVDGHLRVHDWSTNAPEVVRLFDDHVVRGVEDAEQLLDHVVRAGAVALCAVSTSLDLDGYVERLNHMVESELDARVSKVVTALEAAFREDGGALAKALQKYVGEGGSLWKLLDPKHKDSAVAKVEDVLKRFMDGKGSELHKAFDLGNDASPLQPWRREMRDLVDGVRPLCHNKVRQITTLIRRSWIRERRRTDARLRAREGGSRGGP